jgi:hypothetical protein
MVRSDRSRKSWIYLDVKAPKDRRIKTRQRKAQNVGQYMDKGTMLMPGEVLVRPGLSPKWATAFLWNGEKFITIGSGQVSLEMAIDRADAAIALLRRGVRDIDDLAAIG